MNNEDIRNRVEAYRDELRDRLERLVAINSAEGKPQKDAPFGAGPAEALDTALAMMERDGYRTVNVDHYAGYAEMGEGEQLIGVIGHLDVVPAQKSDGWDTDPFTMTEKDGILYGRGVSDDKGAIAASMIAFNVIRDMGVPVHKRVRLIMGTNEETGSRCLQYYVKKEGHVDYGFTPDGDFPVIYGEKGILHAHYTSKKTDILDVRGGAASNIVCGKVTAKVRHGSYSADALKAYAKQQHAGCAIETAGEVDEITITGTPAHASTPDLGINAIGVLFTGLQRAGSEDPFVKFFCSHIGLETDGAMLGLDLHDDYGALTLCCGLIAEKDGVIEGNIDIRFPVSMKGQEILDALKPQMEDENGVISLDDVTEPLFFPPDSPLVKALTSAYVEVTGDTRHKPMVIGGGTYAKEIHNTVAFGCAFPEKDYRIHNTNEWVRPEELLKQAEIYVHGILKLLAI